MKNKSNKEILESFKINFNVALDNIGMAKLHYGRQRDVANRYKVSTSAARKWVTGECLPDVDHMIMIADDLKLSLDQLVGRTSSAFFVQKNNISLPVMAQTIDDDNLSRPNTAHGEVLINSEFLSSSMRIKQNGLELYVISTDSMAPSLNIGDVAFVDTKINKLNDGVTYMLIADSRILIRRVSLGMHDEVTLCSSNPIYPNICLKYDDFYFDKLNQMNSNKVLVVGSIPWSIKKFAGPV